MATGVWFSYTKVIIRGEMIIVVVVVAVGFSPIFSPWSYHPIYLGFSRW
jgi:hypothetical protein